MAECTLEGPSSLANISDVEKVICPLAHPNLRSPPFCLRWRGVTVVTVFGCGVIQHVMPCMWPVPSQAVLVEASSTASLC